MDCQRCQNLISEVLTHDPAVSVGDREAFFEHLGRCWTCRERYVYVRDLTELLQKHGRLSPDTIELLESHGEVVPDHLRPEPEPEEEKLNYSDADIEAGVAKLMAAMKRMDAEEQAEREELEAAKRPPLTEEVADLRRLVNTLEAHQVPWREQWRTQWEEENEDSATAAGGAPEQSPDRLAMPWAHRFGRRWPVMAGLAAAACLALVAMAWSLWQPDSTSPHQVAGQAHSSVELFTASGHQPLALGEPIHSENGVLELLLGGRHRLVLNQGTTATVTAETIAGRDDPAWHVELPQGELYAEVVPDLPGGSRFAVATPNALAIITGTKFNIRAQDEATELTLLKGSVHFASPATGEAVDVTAGHASTVAGRSAPTLPKQVDARLATAWARQPLAGADRQMVGQSLNNLDLLGDMQAAALVPHVPDYRSWSYERFRDEQRDWFAQQFPWAMKLEKALNEQYDIEADYLDVLMLSGDIWQFRYPEPRQSGDRIPAFHPAAVERLAHWYGLDSKSLLEAIGRHRTAGNRPEAEHTGEAFAEAIRRSHTDLAAVTGRDATGDPILFSLQASTYVHHTRAAAYLWVREHPENAERLLASGDYAALFLMALLPSGQAESPLSLQDQLEQQLEACRQSYRFAQQWWLTTSYMSGCSTGSMPPPRQLQRRLLLLVPNEQEGQE
jgi:hypothetical protein